MLRLIDFTKNCSVRIQASQLENSTSVRRKMSCPALSSPEKMDRRKLSCPVFRDTMAGRTSLLRRGKSFEIPKSTKPKAPVTAVLMCLLMCVLMGLVMLL